MGEDDIGLILDALYEAKPLTGREDGSGNVVDIDGDGLVTGADASIASSNLGRQRERFWSYRETSVPTAKSDQYEGLPDQMLVVGAPGVLFNDFDGDGEPVAALIETATVNGALTLHGDGSFEYTPDAGFQGVDSFTYRATDGTTQTLPVTVYLVISDGFDPGALPPEPTPTPIPNEPPREPGDTLLSTFTIVPIGCVLDRPCEYWFMNRVMDRTGDGEINTDDITVGGGLILHTVTTDGLYGILTLTSPFVSDGASMSWVRDPDVPVELPTPTPAPPSPTPTATIVVPPTPTVTPSATATPVPTPTPVPTTPTPSPTPVDPTPGFYFGPDTISLDLGSSSTIDIVTGMIGQGSADTVQISIIHDPAVVAIDSVTCKGLYEGAFIGGPVRVENNTATVLVCSLPAGNLADIGAVADIIVRRTGSGEATFTFVVDGPFKTMFISAGVEVGQGVLGTLTVIDP